MNFEIDFDLYDITILKNTMEMLKNDYKNSNSINSINALNNIQIITKKLNLQEKRILNNK